MPASLVLVRCPTSVRSPAAAAVAPLHVGRRPLQTATSRLKVLVVVLLSSFAPSLAERPSPEHGVKLANSFPRENAAIDFALGVAVHKKAKQDDTRLAFEGRRLNAFTRMDKASQHPSLNRREDVPAKVPPERSALALAQLSDKAALTSNAGELRAHSPHEKQTGKPVGFNEEEERLQKLATITPESLANGITEMKKASPKKVSAPHEHSVEQLLQRRGKSPAWDDLLEDHDKHRGETAKDHWTKLLSNVANKQGLKNDAYTDFYAKVLSIPTGIASQVIADAREVVNQNRDANKQSNQYLGDLKELSNGSTIGYNKMATAHFFADDQVQGQLAVSHISPGKPVRIFFPLGEDAKFKPNTGDLQQPSNDYFNTTFAEQLKMGLEPYLSKKDLKFTVCIHAATPLEAGDVPHNFATKEDHKMERHNGQLIRKGVYRLLQERARTLERNIKGVLKETFAKESDYHFQDLSADLMHFGRHPMSNFIHQWEEDTSMPSGAVLVIAEKRTEQEESQHTEDVNQSDHTKCKIKDFDNMRHFRGPALAMSDDSAFDIWKHKDSNLPPGKQVELPESEQARVDRKKYGYLLHELDKRDTALKEEEEDEEEEDKQDMPQGTTDCSSQYNHLSAAVVKQWSSGTGSKGRCRFSQQVGNIKRQEYKLVPEVEAAANCRIHCMGSNAEHSKAEQGGTCCQLQWEEQEQHWLCESKHAMGPGEGVHFLHDKNSKVKGWCVEEISSEQHAERI